MEMEQNIVNEWAELRPFLQQSITLSWWGSNHTLLQKYAHAFTIPLMGLALPPAAASLKHSLLIGFAFYRECPFNLTLPHNTIN